MRLTPAERQKRYRQRHPERIAAYRSSSNFKEVDRAWRAENRERINASSRAWYAKNRKKPAREPFNEKAWRAAWKKKNMDWYLARSSQYEAVRRTCAQRATPNWANQSAIRDIYRTAKIKTRLLGIRHHVDHIVPLQSKVVCGLHVESNLQILPAADNQRKSNRRWPDMPGNI